MQPLSWYLRRLAAMSPREAAGRAADAARDAADALRVSAGWTPAPPAALLEAGEPRFRVSDVAVGEWAAAPPGSAEAAWRDRLIEAANEVEAHRLTFFDLEGQDLGRTIDWNRDYKSGRRAPLAIRPLGRLPGLLARPATASWSGSRTATTSSSSWLVPTARRARSATPRAVLEQLESWLDACPFGRGMNWRSPLELGIRLINWVWALDLIRESGLPEEPLRSRVLASVHLHVWEIARRYSGGSSANNHLIGRSGRRIRRHRVLPWRSTPLGRIHDESREILAARDPAPEPPGRRHPRAGDRLPGLRAPVLPRGGRGLAGDGPAHSRFLLGRDSSACSSSCEA